MPNNEGDMLSKVIIRTGNERIISVLCWWYRSVQSIFFTEI